MTSFAELARARLAEITRGHDGTLGIAGEVFASVWDAIEDEPHQAANMRLRSELMIAIQQAVGGCVVPQTAAAKRQQITQPRLRDLLRGCIGNFSLDALVDLAERAGLKVRVLIAPLAA